MKNDELIDIIYKSTIDYVIKNIDSRYLDEIKINFLSYLRQLYSDEKLSEDEIMREIELERNNLSKLSLERKLSIFISDKAYENIKEISSMSYKYASLKAMGINNISLDISVINEYKEKLRHLLSNVQDFNKNVASQEVSDAILDLNYLIEDTGVYSSRLLDVFIYVKSLS